MTAARGIPVLRAGAKGGLPFRFVLRRLLIAIRSR
jgi:hypothetical protein